MAGLSSGASYLPYQMKDVYTLADLDDPTALNPPDAQPAKLAVIGHPVAHSQSPQLHQPALDALNIDAKNPRAWAALAGIREQQGQLAQALSNYRQAYQLNQALPGMTNRIASLQQRIASAASGVSASPGTQIVTSPINSTAR